MTMQQTDPKTDIIELDAKQLKATSYIQTRDRSIPTWKEFLSNWHFIDQETGEIRTFKNRWPGQDRFADLMEKEPWIFALKARKLGFSEIECAWDGYVATTQPRARVHLFSRREDAAADLKQRVEFGLKALPDGLRLPVLSSSYLQLTIGHETDKRTIVAYPASPETAVEQTCNHGHVDEYARMGTSDRDRVLIWRSEER